MHIGVLHSRVRVEERLIFEALVAKGIQAELVDLREAVFEAGHPGEWARFDAVIDRSVSLTDSLTCVRMFESFGVRCINQSHAIETCSDKLRTSLALIAADVPTPGVRVAVAGESALRAVEANGYPAVLKPTVGSWGRLVARVNDRDAAEAVIEHRETLGSTNQHVFYVQDHIEKPGRDIRVFVVGGQAIAAITRTSAHWVTNTARGAQAAGLAISAALGDLSCRAAAAVGADVCAIDVLECPKRGLLVNEINHSMEFRNSITTTGVDIPGRVVDHVLSIARAIVSGRPSAAVGARA